MRRNEGGMVWSGRDSPPCLQGTREAGTPEIMSTQRMNTGGFIFYLFTTDLLQLLDQFWYLNGGNTPRHSY